ALAGRAAPTLLDTYHAERHPAGYAIAEASSTVRGHVGDMLAAFTKPDNRHDDLPATMFGTQYAEGAFVPDGRGPAPVGHYAPAGRPGTRVPHAWLDATTSTVDFAGPGLTLLTGPDDERWITEASDLGLRLVKVSHQDWLAEVCLPPDGALLLRPDAIVAWHSASATPLAEALSRVLGTKVASVQPQ
ncbi:FAD-dependent oxidoreductase, partial [Amycolatopsis mediterranei]